MPELGTGVRSYLGDIIDTTQIRAALEAEIAQLAAKIGATGREVVGFAANDAAYPFLHVASDGLLHFVAQERGQLLEDRTTDDVDELLYWCFSATTWQMAAHWELHHRVAGEDVRKGLWSKQAELLYTLDPYWARRWRSELPADAADIWPALPDD